MNQDLFDYANRQQVYLERLKSGFDRQWGLAQVELRRKMREVLGALEAENLQDLDRKELQSVLIKLRKVHLETTAFAMNKFKEQLPELADYAAGAEAVALAAATGGATVAIPTAASLYAAALENPVQATGELLSDMISNWSKADAMRVSNVIQKGWGQGKTLQSMIREVVGTKANGYKDGILDISRKNAGTVIHTATQHVASASRMALWEENSDIAEEYEWASTLDRRTSQQCKSLDGTIYKLGKGPMPPIHPNCRSTTVAVLDKKFDFLKKGETRANAGPNPGQVDASLTYYDWLRQQPSDFQVTALGPVRAKLFQSGGLTPAKFAELNIGRNFEPLTLKEMRVLQPDAFKRAGF